MNIKSVAVFCGSSAGSDPVYADHARRLAAELVQRNIRLVYGAGSVGLMGLIADEVLRLGGAVLGVIPQFLVDKEVGHTGLTELVVTQSMHERKRHMAAAADAFIALSGGIGTLEEIIEVFTWTQLGIHEKPCALLNVAGYYDHLLSLLDHMVGEKFLRDSHRHQLISAADAGAVLDEIAVWRGGVHGKWQ